MILPPPQSQSTLPHEFSLMSTRISDNHLSLAVDEKKRSEYFVSKSFDNPFLSIMIAPRLFPQKILEIKVYKTPSIPQIAVVIIRYTRGQEILTKSFCSPILGLVNAAKWSACKLACKYIIKNFMDELKQLDGDTLGSNIEPDGDQHDDEDDNPVNIGIPPHIEGVPAGEPSAIREESFDKDEPTNSTINQDDVNLLSELLAVPTEDRKRKYDEDLTNGVVKTSDDRFNNVEGSPIFSKILKTH